MTASCRRPLPMDRADTGSRALLCRDKRAGMTILISFLIPAMIAIGLLGIDAVRALSQAAQINYATQLAATAAAAAVNTVGADSGATVQSYATTIAQANFPGLTSSDVSVVTGTYNTSTNIVTPPANGAVATAVQVTSSVTVSTVLGGLFGVPTLAITKTSISSIPTTPGGTGSNPPVNGVVNTNVNILVLNDVEKTFNSIYGYPDLGPELSADLAILKCLHGNGGANAKFGIIPFALLPPVNVLTKPSAFITPLTSVGSTFATLSAKLATAMTVGNVSSGNQVVPYCTQPFNPKQNATPSCRGSNVASALYAAIQVFSASAYQGANNHIVIITDELPSADPAQGTPGGANYSTVAFGGFVAKTNGVWATTATAPACAPNSSTSTCTNADLTTWAEGQAAIAGQNKIIVSTVYYADATVATAAQSAADTEIASWVQNGGFHKMATATSQITPTSAVTTAASNVCQYFGSRLISTGS